MARNKQDGSQRRIYHVTSKSGEEWLIRAVSQSQAIRCASEGVYKAEPAHPETLVKLVGAGKQVIDAGADQSESESA